jgi:hypothetical protein
MFQEETVDSLETVDSATYHTLRSVHNSRWYLGVSSPSENQEGQQQRRRRPSGRQRFTAARRLVRPPPDFCGSHFSSGRHGPPMQKAFYGVFDLVSDYMDGNRRSRVNLKNSLAANRDSSSSSSSSSSSQLATSPSSPLSPTDSVVSHDDDDDGGRSGDIIGDDDDKRIIISAAHLEALRMQHQLTGQEQRHRIRHAKHKRPRPSRQQKNLARQAAQAKNSAESAVNM